MCPVANLGKDRSAFRGFVEGLAGIDDLRLLTMSHAAPIRNPAEALREAGARL
jgi:hypothetical protein